MMIRYRCKKLKIGTAWKFAGDEERKFFEHLKSIKSEDIWIGLDVVDQRKMRTVQQNRQNRYYYGIVLRDFCCPYYGYDVDDMDMAFRMKFLRFENVNGLPTIRSPKSLKTDEFWAYIEQVRRYVAMEDGINIPDPERVPGRIAQ
jgi:hypothetical protein